MSQEAGTSPFILQKQEKKSAPRHVFARVFTIDPDVAAPAINRAKDEDFYSKKDPSKPDLEFLRTFFMNEGRLTIKQATFIIKKATDILKKEGTVLDLDAPLTGISRLTSLRGYSWPIF